MSALRSPAVNLHELATRVEAAHFPDPTASRDPRFLDPTATDDAPSETTTSTGIYMSILLYNILVCISFPSPKV